ncbi:MAG: acetyl-CoA carboxylase carboxyltransferase subunit beta [Alphaproteobacteria bacterium]|nr:acetyl-CoA carboxylase carboxyltransferase subunit beta [Alphaproteobacteria bacterium]
MSWFTTFVRPKISALMRRQEIPDNLWHKCTDCEQMVFHRDLVANQYVCSHCAHHMAIPVKMRLENLFDQGNYTRVPLQPVPVDPLKFKDSKKYPDRLKTAREKTGEMDAIVVAEGYIGGYPVVISAFDFSFIGGSMGLGIGEGLVRGAERACELKAAYLTIPASGGARMQEGILSLMQMPRSVIAVEQVKEAGLPYIPILTNPTTGGVAASFAMLGDIAIAEPGALIGFTGPRVLQETIRCVLPIGFQSAEFQLTHGMVDMVVHRANIRQKLIDIFGVLMGKTA